VKRPPTKKALKEELVAVLQADLDALERAQKATREGATHEEAKPENDKDTRALEQSYLARGQAVRVDELRNGLAMLNAMQLREFPDGAPVALGALVTTDDGEDENVLWMAPHGGGARLHKGTIQVVTPKSPLGQGLLGKCEGEECQVRLAGRVKELTLTRVQ
jgi:transcription elongation GreA/GreB family factor